MPSTEDQELLLTVPEYAMLVVIRENQIKLISNKEKLLKKLLKTCKSKNSKYDCIVPWSGGKDSSYVAYQLKFKYGANPLLATLFSVNTQ